jgi:hypothetical protein
MSELEETKNLVKEWLRARYLVPDAPSVFDQYGSVDSDGSTVNRIEPNLFLFSWQALGPDAKDDQRKYLRKL